MADERINALAVTADFPAPDDFDVLDGAANGSRKLPSWQRIGWLATRQAGGFVYSDGTTAGRAQIQAPGARGNLAGAALASWVGWVEVPTANPSASASIFQSGPSIADPSNALSLGCYIINTGALYIAQNGTPNSNYRLFSHSTFRAAYSGRRIWFEVRFVQGATNPIVRVDSVDISGAFSVTTGGTPPGWIDATLGSVYHIVGYNWPVGVDPLGSWLNAHLSDTESTAWWLTGRPPVWVAAGGSQINQISDTARNADFSAGATDWTNELGTQANISVASGQLTVNGGNNWAGPRTSDLIGGAANVMFSVGRRGRVVFDFVSGAATSFQVWLGGNAQGSAVAASTGQRVVLEWTNDRNDAPIRIRANGSYTIDNVAFQQLGALALLRPQQIAVADDWTTLGGNSARLVGMQPITPDDTSRIAVASQSFGAGTSVQILGGAVIGSLKQRILSISGNSSANTTISLGTSSGGTQLVNAQAVNGDFDVATFASRIVVGGSSLWVTFAGATTANVTIRLANL